MIRNEWLDDLGLNLALASSEIPLVGTAKTGLTLWGLCRRKDGGGTKWGLWIELKTDDESRQSGNRSEILLKGVERLSRQVNFGLLKVNSRFSTIMLEVLEFNIGCMSLLKRPLWCAAADSEYFHYDQIGSAPRPSATQLPPVSSQVNSQQGSLQSQCLSPSPLCTGVIQRWRIMMTLNHHSSY